MSIKILLPVVLLLLLAVFPAQAQGTVPPIPPSPSNGNYIIDELDWLTGQQESSINTTIRGLDQDGVAEIAVVTLDDCGPDKLAFRKSLFDTWGIGHADDNDGLLILVCWYGGDASRRSVEQIYGRGLNGILNSSKTDRIAQTKFVPAFQQGDPGDGLQAMVTSYNIILRAAGESSKPPNPLVQFYEGISRETKENLIFILLFAVLVVGQHYFSKWFGFRSKRDHDRDDYGDRDGFGGGRSEGGGGSSTRF